MRLGGSWESVPRFGVALEGTRRWADPGACRRWSRFFVPGRYSTAPARELSEIVGASNGREADGRWRRELGSDANLAGESRVARPRGGPGGRRERVARPAKP